MAPCWRPVTRVNVEPSGAATGAVRRQCSSPKAQDNRINGKEHPSNPTPCEWPDESGGTMVRDMMARLLSLVQWHLSDDDSTGD